MIASPCHDKPSVIKNPGEGKENSQPKYQYDGRVPHATISLTGTEFRVVTKTATFSTIWSTFTELWRLPDFWLLIMGKGQYITLPTADLTPQARDLIVARIKASGGKT